MRLGAHITGSSKEAALTPRSDTAVDPRKTTARVILAMTTAMLVLFLLFSSGPGGAISFAQGTPSPSASACQGANIEWVNPSSHSSEISAEDKGGDAAGSGQYHLVAWVNFAPANSIVEFKYSAGTSTAETTITPANVGATKVGTDTYEWFWPATGTDASKTIPNDGPITLKAQLFASGVLCDQDNQSATVNDDAEAASPGPPPSPASGAAEGVEIVSPENGGEWGVYRHPESAVSTGLVDMKLSKGQATQPPTPPDPEPSYVRLVYSISAPGTEPAWKDCDNSPVETGGEDEMTERCELASDDDPEEVNLVGAVANDTPTAPDGTPLPFDAANNDSGDAHRVVPYRQNATTVVLQYEDGNGAAAGSPSPNQSSAQATGGCTPLLVGTFTDQKGRPIANLNVDSHAQGPSDALKFASGGGTHAFKNPDKGTHTSEPAHACGTGANGTGGSSSGNQGDHEEQGEFDIKHIESTNNTNNQGKFIFRLHSPVDGSTQVVVFADEDADDQYCSSEANASASASWGAGSAAPAPAGPSSEETFCPIPGATVTPSPSSPSPSSPSPTASSPSPTPTETVGPGLSQSRTRFTSFRYRRGAFRGQIDSDYEPCDSNRSIVIRKVRRGPDRVVARDRTDGGGRFSARERNARGRFYATATAKSIIEPDGDQVDCRARRSGTIRARG